DNNQNRPAVVINPISEEDLNSERELMTSEFLIKQAIAGVPEQPDNSVAALMLKGVSGALSLPSLGYDVLHSVPAVSAKDDWAIRIAKHLDSTVIKRSNVIELSFTSHDQRWTKDFLSRLINQYIAFHAQISHDPQAEKFFNEQAEVLEARLHASEDKLRQFRLQSGITDLDGQTKALIDRISQLNLERDRDAAATASARQQAAFLEEILQKTPERISKETRSVQNEALSQLKPQV